MFKIREPLTIIYIIVGMYVQNIKIDLLKIIQILL